MTYPIKPVDTVRKPGDMLPADLEGVEGRWLDVPRLQQKNPDENQSNYWCGRTSASMVVSYYAKFAGKDDEQIGHNDGPQGIGSNGQKKNIRWLGGSMKDKLAGVNDQGKCWPIGAFKAMNWGTDSGELCNEKNYASLRPTDESFVQETFKRHLEQLKKNNPVVQYTQLTDNRGHIVCIVGYKKDAQGRLWLRVNDPCYVHKKLIGPGNYQMIKEPSSASSYSEYWIRAGRLLETYPGRSTPLFAHGDAKGGTFQYAIPDKPVPDDHELVHLIKQGQAADVGATNPTTSTPPAGGDSPAPSTPAATTPAATAPAGGDAPKDGPVTAKPPPADDSATKGPDEADIEADVIAGAYKDRGAYTSGTGFNDKALNKLLAKYCKDDGIDPKAQSKGGSSSGGGGDLEASTTADIPLWLEKWRQTVSNSGAWGKKEQGRSRLAEAFYRKFFRDKISAAGLKYPPVADEFFAQLFKSNMNKQCKDLGGPGNGYCAAASSVALQRELQARGYQMVPHKKWGGTVVGKDALPDLAGSKFASTKPQPGDILSLVTSGTPRTGHVVTVLLPMGENFVDGAIWVVSGNTGPGNGTIAVDIIHPAAKPASFNPLDGKSWDQSGDTKPPAGKAWIYAVQLGGNVVPDLVDAMSDDDKKANFVTSAPAKPTPGSQAAPEIQHPWPEGGGDAPAPSTPGAPATPSTPGAPATPSSGGTKPGGAQAGGDTPAAPKKEDPGAAPQPAANPPMSGNTRMPFDLNGSSTVTGEDITALYHQSERGLGGFFPLGDTGIFHCGAHFTPSAGSKLYAIADGEVVAFRNGTTPGEHPWGDTGFVILRHPVKDNKLVYSMFVHLKKEPLHPDRTNAPWLSQVLKDAMQDKDKKPSWRITTAMPTWKDEDKGKFSPTNVQNDKLLDPGVYEEEEELVQDEKRFIKVKDKNVWVKVTDSDKAKELSPWHDFDIDKASKNSANVKALVDGKTAVFDSEKGEDKKHKVKVSAGECVGLSGNYLEGATVHWSVFTKDDIFPSGSLPDEEYTSADPVKVQALDLSGKDAGTKEQTKAFLDVLDKDKKFLGTKEDASIMEPGELRGFYRTPTHGWKTRYLSVKGIADFKLDADKFVKQDRYKSHTEKEKKE
ncbi:MAG: C39 family peptidase, partial [Deltaproteobacteria bacterium]|nr:C39 family peptidase [Deltaproteobacteria bacterium]